LSLGGLIFECLLPRGVTPLYLNRRLSGFVVQKLSAFSELFFGEMPCDKTENSLYLPANPP